MTGKWAVSVIQNGPFRLSKTAHLIVSRTPVAWWGRFGWAPLSHGFPGPFRLGPFRSWAVSVGAVSEWGRLRLGRSGIGPFWLVFENGCFFVFFKLKKNLEFSKFSRKIVIFPKFEEILRLVYFMMVKYHIRIDMVEKRTWRSWWSPEKILNIHSQIFVTTIHDIELTLFAWNIVTPQT